MPFQYIQDNKGQTTAVLIPIKDWKRIKSKYPEIDEEAELPQWQKDMIDERLSY